MPAATKVEMGDRFGRLVVIREVATHRTPNGSSVRRVECECDCGEVGEFRLPGLRSGHTKSCGCLVGDVNSEHVTTHGGSGTPEYTVWRGMLARCKDQSSDRYGGRGIRVCERWESFENFLADMGPRPSSEHSIDRYPDNDGDYEPGNCRWATRVEQMRNTSVNRMVTHNGETLCVAEWAERYGMSSSMLNNRLHAGWSFEKSVSSESNRGDDSAFMRTPIKDRDAAWYREYERRKA